MSSRRFIALGTASQVPTRERNHNGYFLRWDAEGFLFDPGEGTQRQMTRADVSATDLTKIFITHFHGDHCLGLAGVIQRISLDRVPQTVEIYYPASGEKFVDNLANASIFHNNAKIDRVPISTEGVICRGRDFDVESYRLDHTAESWGYRIVERDSMTLLPEKLAALGVAGRDIGVLKSTGRLERDGGVVTVEEAGVLKKGQSFAFVMDTRMCANAVRLAAGVDMLVCESTYLASESAEARAHGHLTASEAASIALEADAKSLVLTHFSQRYPDTRAFVREARKIFPNVVAVRDGDAVDLERQERAGNAVAPPAASRGRRQDD